MCLLIGDEDTQHSLIYLYGPLALLVYLITKCFQMTFGLLLPRLHVLYDFVNGFMTWEMKLNRNKQRLLMMRKGNIAYQIMNYPVQYSK